MQYFNTQQITIDHVVEEHDNYINFHDDDEVPLEDDRRDFALGNLQ